MVDLSIAMLVHQRVFRNIALLEPGSCVFWFIDVRSILTSTFFQRIDRDPQWWDPYSHHFTILSGFLAMEVVWEYYGNGIPITRGPFWCTGYSSWCTIDHHGPPGMSPAGSNDLEEWRCSVGMFWGLLWLSTAVKPRRWLSHHIISWLSHHIMVISKDDNHTAGDGYHTISWLSHHIMVISKDDNHTAGDGYHTISWLSHHIMVISKDDNHTAGDGYHTIPVVPHKAVAEVSE